jgi:uncharacterized membrane protein (DUF485 family)
LLNIPDSWKNWIIAIGLLIFAGLASATWLWFSSQDSGSEGASAEVPAAEPLPVVIQFKDYVLGSDLLQIDAVSELDGTTITQGQVVIVAFIVTTVVVVGLGVILTLLSWFTSRQVTAVESDEDYLAAINVLNDRQKELVKELKGEQPTNQPQAAAKRAGWSWFATSLLIIILVWITGLILGVTFLDDVTWNIFGLEVNASSAVNLILILITAVILYVYVRRRDPTDLQSGKTDYQPINWGTVWIVVTGLLIVGIGTGLAVAMRSIGS